MWENMHCLYIGWIRLQTRGPTMVATQVTSLEAIYETSQCFLWRYKRLSALFSIQAAVFPKTYEQNLMGKINNFL